MQKKAPLESKPKLHRRNLHLNGYDFDSLCKTEPELTAFVKINEFNQRTTIDFSNAEAVKLLNKSFLDEISIIFNSTEEMMSALKFSIVDAWVSLSTTTIS